MTKRISSWEDNYSHTYTHTHTHAHTEAISQSQVPQSFIVMGLKRNDRKLSAETN
jgi:hypothetical protein